MTQPSDRAASLYVSGMLAAVGGFLDGFTYVGHGQVFANAMSANAILLAANCFTGTWHKTVVYLPPILAFLSAVWLSRGMQLSSKQRAARPPYAGVLAMEMLV